ncbi:hypothetical protein Q5P01_011809 [Channa striata]|uniref:N-acetyltransferase domain-containing protein n=1 Tax=Channa striata TaxID=64152 RepID=A0AA88MXN0_CHASR|nr:hypothetical protein Q5P01_011809 [Channa striata]
MSAAEDVEYSLAQEHDFQQVLNICGSDVFDGLDYMAVTFHRWLQEPGRLVFIAKMKDRAVALESALLVDGGQTAVLQGLRVTPDMRGLGIAGALQKHVIDHIRRHYPRVSAIRLSRGDQPSPQTLAKYRLVAKEAILTLCCEAADLGTFVGELSARLPSRADSWSHAPVILNQQQVEILILTEHVVSNLLPSKTIINDWEPLKPVEANLEVLRRRGLTWIVDQQSEPSAVSLCTTRHKPLQQGRLQWDGLHGLRLQEPGRLVFIAKMKDRVVALESMLLVDGGQTVLIQGVRVTPELRGGGTASALQKTDVHCVTPPEAVLSLCCEATDLGLFVAELQSRLPLQTASSPCCPVTLTQQQVEALILTDHVVSNLLPGKTIINNWEPLKPVEANLEILRRRESMWTADREFEPSVLSLCSPLYPNPAEVKWTRAGRVCAEDESGPGRTDVRSPRTRRRSETSLSPSVSVHGGLCLRRPLPLPSDTESDTEEAQGNHVNPADVPALEIKLGALAVLLSVTLLFGFAPLCIIRGAGRCSVDSDLRRRLLSLISCFAGGVFLATCLLDLLPDYLQGVNEAFSSAGITLQFPLPEFIVSMGFFLVLVLEQIILAFKDQSSLNLEEHRALLVDSSVQANDRSGRRLSHHRHHGSVESDGGHFHVDFSSQSALRAFILVFSLSLHSVFEGLAVGLQEDSRDVLEICLALMIHKSIISFSLSFKLCQGRLRRSVVASCLLLFAIMSPLGIGLGIGLTEAKASPQHQLARCTLEGLAAGTFIYITFMEILPHELSSPRNRMPKVAMLLVGFAMVTAVLFIKL